MGAPDPRSPASQLVPFEGVFAALADPAEVAKVSVCEDVGTICWPGGADLDPCNLHSLVATSAGHSTAEGADPCP
jgi:hypothetical protein